MPGSSAPQGRSEDWEGKRFGIVGVKPVFKAHGLTSIKQVISNWALTFIQAFSNCLKLIGLLAGKKNESNEGAMLEAQE